MFVKFPSIESYAHVIRNRRKYGVPGRVTFGAKIKLHGTNAGVTVTEDGVVVAQSRSRIITPTDDNVGFASWVKDTASAWKNAADHGPQGRITFFGEWAGKGVQRGDAVCQLEGKYFFIFAIQIGDDVIVSPDEIEKLSPDLDNVLVLPWDRIWTQPVNLWDDDDITALGDSIQNAISHIENQDPFIYGIFGIEGRGEGLVICPVCAPEDDPVTSYSMPRDVYSALTFKAKTAHHTVKKGQGVKKEVVVPDGVPEFVDMFVTTPRLEQGLDAVGGVADPRKTGEFLKWFGQDVHKESVVELEDSGLEWKDVAKHVTSKARNWWLTKCSEI